MAAAEAIFWVAFAAIAYTYIGYPAWLTLRGWTGSRPVRRGDAQPTVSIVIAAHNEASSLRARVDNC